MNTRRGAWDEVLQFVYQGQGFWYHFVREESNLSEWPRRKCKLESNNSLTDDRTRKRRISPFDSSQNRFSTSSTKFNATFKHMNNKVCDTYYVLCTTTSSNSTTLSSLSIICPGVSREV